MQAVALVEAIHREHLAARESSKTALAHALACGQLLLDAKAQCDHGEWLPWLEANVAFSEMTAQRYMKLARNPTRALDLSIRDALLLAKADDDAAELAKEAWNQLTPQERAQALNRARKSTLERGRQLQGAEKRQADLLKVVKWLVKSAQRLSTYAPYLEERAAALAAEVRRELE